MNGGILTASLAGSLITIAIKAFIDAISENKRHKRELRKLVFQRKTDAVEKAISWYQETLDTYSMMQLAFNQIDAGSNDFALVKMRKSGIMSMKLFDEASSRLNPIYLYYDFSDIASKYDEANSQQRINDGLSAIIRLDQLSSGNCDENQISEMRNNVITIFRSMSNDVQNCKDTIVAIQSKLRSDYKKHNVY